MTVRIATLSEAELLAELHRRSIREVCAPHYAPQEVEAWLEVVTADAYSRFVTASHAVVLVEEDRDRLRGLAVCDPSEEMINAVYVSPLDLGRGVGSALLREAEAVLRAGGASTARLIATLNAIGFYERHGYESSGPVSNVLPSGVELPGVAFSRGLG